MQIYSQRRVPDEFVRPAGTDLNLIHARGATSHAVFQTPAEVLKLEGEAGMPLPQLR